VDERAIERRALPPVHLDRTAWRRTPERHPLMTSMDKHPLEHVGPGKPIVPAHPGFVSTPPRVKWRVGEPLHATLGTSWGRTWLRTLCLACSGVVLFYSGMVLWQVAWMGTIGVRCLFGTDVEEEVPADFLWTPTTNVEGGAK